MSEERLNHYKKWIEDNEEIVVDSSIFEELVKEIERLKTELEIEQDISEGMLETIDKAIEYIDYYLKNGHTKDWKQLEYSLLEILKKEENNEPSSIDRETN